MPLIEPIIRPPSEADSLLLQVTSGCSSNTCTFCGAYKNKPFQIMPESVIANDIKIMSKRYPDMRRIFLLDGDVLVLNNQKLIPILKLINQSFPKLTRISSYANGFNVTSKNDNELNEIFANKLSLVYMGLESGSQDILDACHKRSSVKEMISAVNRLSLAGMKSSVIVLLGLGGKKYSKEHVAQTITALNQMQPRYLSFLSLMVIPGTILYERIRKGDFEELNSFELLEEAHNIIQGLELNKTIFRSDHASNYLPLEGRFPKDKAMLLDVLKAGMEGRINLKPELFRGL